MPSPVLDVRALSVQFQTSEGPLRVLASPIRFSDTDVEYKAPPRLHEHTDDVRPLHSGGG